MYDKFILKHVNQEFETGVYTELHHIVPKHMGGNNDISNFIRLTYRQHILAHLLLYRKYKKYEDLCAYKLMKSLPQERKSLISSLIGNMHKESGHIYKLGNYNRDSGFINKIKTTDSLRKGGLAAGKIAKESGQILSIRTDEGSRAGGITAGKYAKERGQIQSLGKYRGTYILIMPDGKEFEHGFQAEEYMGIDKKLILSRCKAGNLGYSRRKKTKEELENRWANIE